VPDFSSLPFAGSLNSPSYQRPIYGTSGSLECRFPDKVSPACSGERLDGDGAGGWMNTRGGDDHATTVESAGVCGRLNVERSISSFH
jgi:hypothetical protein